MYKGFFILCLLKLLAYHSELRHSLKRVAYYHSAAIDL